MSLPDPTSLLTSLVSQFISQGIGSGLGSKNQGQLTPGVSPEQAALAQYGYGQNLLQDRALFAGGPGGSGGPGTSTMSTQAAGGGVNRAALMNAEQSDRNMSQQFSQLQQLAQNAGFGAGSGGLG